jgi:hypothetical protein
MAALAFVFERREVLVGMEKRMKGMIVLLFIAAAGLANGQQEISSSVNYSSSIGLGIGQQAPTFALADQFGHEQSNDTLKGLKGTILLFFRSADW